MPTSGSACRRSGTSWRSCEKPGRDPRPQFRTAAFTEGVEELEHLQPGMMLEGVVTNVANFGAFVDIGVHQDGLVHVSRLADRFVKDPREVVKAGDIVRVKVLEVDLKRRRIALTMSLGEARVGAARARARRAAAALAPGPPCEARGAAEKRATPAPSRSAEGAARRDGDVGGLLASAQASVGRRSAVRRRMARAGAPAVAEHPMVMVSYIPGSPLAPDCHTCRS